MEAIGFSIERLSRLFSISLLIAVCGIGSANAKDFPQTTLQTRISYGEIYDIDLVNRQATINGLTYGFGKALATIQPKMKLLGSEQNAVLEMLAVGMKVKVVYAPTLVRHVMELEQVPYDSDVAE